MRDDDDIRLYMPVLQRIIILVAVIVAVPVVLWTITAFVRTYVGPPQLPTFQRLSDAQPSDNAAANPQADSTASQASPGTPSSPAAAADQTASGTAPMQLAPPNPPMATDQAAMRLRPRPRLRSRCDPADGRPAVQFTVALPATAWAVAAPSPGAAPAQSSINSRRGPIRKPPRRQTVWPPALPTRRRLRVTRAKICQMSRR